MKILVMSCDKNKDLWLPFYHCMEKYWPEHPEVIYSSENLINPYYKTILSGEVSWGIRVKKCLEEISDEHILLTLDDIFIREKVDNNLINSLVDILKKDSNIGYLNLEGEFRKKGYSYNSLTNIFNPETEIYKISVMLNIFKKDCLYELANDVDAWQFEKQESSTNYYYLITKTPAINFGKNKNTICNWGIVQGKWTRECLSFLEGEGIKIEQSEREVIGLKKCFGIISYFPWEQPARKERQDRLDRLVNQLSYLWPDIPIMIISQQWKYYNLNGKCNNRIFRFDYPKLGILNARQKLREHFLESEFDYLIMFDDDAIIEADRSKANDYIREIDKNPYGFCFIKGNGSSPYTNYADSQLNLCAISRYIYEREPIPNIDPEQSQAFEDRIWTTLLHYKYADKEFNAPEGIRCIHFKNPNETAPSTWSGQQKYNWNQLRKTTREIEKYIVENRRLPEWVK